MLANLFVILYHFIKTVRLGHGLPPNFIEKYYIYEAYQQVVDGKS